MMASQIDILPLELSLCVFQVQYRQRDVNKYLTHPNAEFRKLFEFVCEKLQSFRLLKRELSVERLLEKTLDHATVPQTINGIR